MSTIYLSAEEYRKIYRTLRHAVLPKTTPKAFESRMALRYVEMRCESGKYTATALTGFILMQVQGPCKGGDDAVFLMPLIAPMADSDAIITAEKGKFSLTQGDTTITKVIPDVVYINWYQIVRDVPKTTARIAFSASLLRKIADAFAGETILFEITDETHACIVRSATRCGLLLPVRIADATQDKLAKFAKGLPAAQVQTEAQKQANAEG
ncbi:MAG: hypothetical protein LLF96_03130 [Eubacteriales bacterium]|nr:hypothetical protein [Eubacteriales bacterium]